MVKLIIVYKSPISFYFIEISTTFPHPHLFWPTPTDLILRNVATPLLPQFIWDPRVIYWYFKITHSLGKHAVRIYSKGLDFFKSELRYSCFTRNSSFLKRLLC